MVVFWAAKLLIIRKKAALFMFFNAKKGRTEVYFNSMCRVICEDK